MYYTFRKKVKLKVHVTERILFHLFTVFHYVYLTRNDSRINGNEICMPGILYHAFVRYYWTDLGLLLIRTHAQTL